MADSIEKNTRVRIVKGRKGAGVSGTVFWTGPDKYSDGGERCGVRGDDGETYWVSMDVVEVLAESDADFAAPEKKPPPDLEKGSRVSWKDRGESGTGTVFWVGESKSGEPRVGLNDDETGETVWLFADRTELLEDQSPPEKKKTTKKAGAKKAGAKAGAKKTGARKKTKTSGGSELSKIPLSELESKVADQPYAVFVECERRLEADGKSVVLKAVAGVAAAAIEDRLLAPSERDEIISAFMDFAHELNVDIFIDDEPEEGVTQAMGILEDRLAEFV